MLPSYNRAELVLLGYALSLSCALLLFGSSPQIATIPPFLAWIMLNRSGSSE
jgi:hypothetical protein